MNEADKYLFEIMAMLNKRDKKRKKAAAKQSANKSK